MGIYRRLFFFLFVVFISGCNSFSDFNEIKNFMVDEEPVFLCDLPSFPIEVLYVLTKEYESGRVDGSVALDTYLDQRLIELYPEKAYIGLVGESRSQFEKEIKRYEQYLVQLNDLHSVQFDEGLNPLKSEEMDDVGIQYTEEEQQYLDMLESYSKDGQLLSKYDLDLITNNANNLKSVPYLAMPLTFTAWGSSAIIGCIMVCVKRVDQKALDFNMDRLKYGTVDDAFGHIYLGLLLRRYLNRTYAWAISGSYEVFFKNEDARDTYMDYHNNKIGRLTKYRLLRGKWYQSCYDWELWAERVKEFVDDREGNGYFTDWLETDPDKEEAKTQAKKISDEKYIYFRKQ